jgi:serine protease
LVNRLLDKQVFIVAAVGNTYGQKLAEPANCEGVISVGAVDPDNRVENYSALDARTVIYAPGRTPRAMGTSYAAPLVSGFIALLLTQQPSLRPTDFQALLPRYSREVQPVAKCPECSPRGLLMSSLKQ